MCAWPDVHHVDERAPELLKPRCQLIRTLYESVVQKRWLAQYAQRTSHRNTHEESARFQFRKPDSQHLLQSLLRSYPYAYQAVHHGGTKNLVRHCQIGARKLRDRTALPITRRYLPQASPHLGHRIADVAT